MNSLNTPPLAIDFDDFSYRSSRCEMGKIRDTPSSGGTAFTKLVYSNDLLTLTDEWADISAEDFRDKSDRVLGAWFTVFPETLIVSQRCTLRALVQPKYFSDSRIFIGDKVLGFRETMPHSLKGKTFKVGFNISKAEKIVNSQTMLEATVNSWRDNKTVWLQVEGGMLLAKPINAASGVDSSKQLFDASKQFLEEDIVKFLNSFDQTEKKQ